MDFKEKLQNLKETAKGLLRDMRRGCTVVKKVASDFYHKNPDAIVAIGAVATGTAFLAGAVKGCDVGLEAGRKDAAETVGIMYGAAEGTMKMLDGLDEDEKRKIADRFLNSLDKDE